MTGMDLFRTLSDIDQDLILRASPDGSSCTCPQKGRNPSRLAFGLMAACLLLAVVFGMGIGRVLLPAFTTPAGNNAETPSRIHVVWMGGILYHPYYFGSYAYCEERYPEMFVLSEDTGEPIPITITTEHLGDRIGDLPADETFDDIPAGYAYRFALRPDDESIFIAERAGTYRFYIADGSQINQGIPTPAALAFFIHGLPDTCLLIRSEDKNTADIEILASTTHRAIFALLENKEAADYTTILAEQWADYAARYGETTTLSYNGRYVESASQPEMQAFVDFSNRCLHAYTVSTTKGFRDMSFFFDSTYRYVLFCGNYYRLSAEEAVRMAELLEIPPR